VRITLQLGELAGKESREYPDFVSSLLLLLPGLETHSCSGIDGGFPSRLREGTYFGHIYEHVVLELQALLGYKVSFGKTRRAELPGEYTVVLEYGSEAIIEKLCRLGVLVIESLLGKHEFSLETTLQELAREASEYDFGPSTQAIVDAARKRGITVRRIGSKSLVQLGTGRFSRRIQATIGPHTSCLAADLACDKQMTKNILERAGITVPYGQEVSSVDEAVTVALAIGPPVVIKPTDGNQGKGVSLNVSTREEVHRAYALARQYSSRVMVEEHIAGRNYRFLTVNYNLVAVSERIPAHVDGDGVHSVAELLETVNANPLRGLSHEKPLTKIVVDDVVRQVLSRQGVEMQSIPALGERVFLRDNANISTGGIARDVTDQVHPTLRHLAERVSRVLSLDIAGIDMVLASITEPHTAGAVIEVNAAPGLRMHLYPAEGQSRDVAGAIVDMLYPPGSRCDIPVIAVTGTNGKTTTSRLIGCGLRKIHENVGVASSTGIYINEDVLMKGDTTGPWSASLLLSEPNLDAAVLEVARGGILRAGLGYDLADIAVLTNIAEDHLGQDGVEDLHDLAHVKGLVVEAVRRHGWVVTKGDDPHCLKLAERAGRATVLFAAEPSRELLRHLGSGGRCVYAQEGLLIAAEGDNLLMQLPLQVIPLTFGGQARHNVENCAAAVGALWASGLSFSCIEELLREFAPDLRHNPGRQNIISVGNVKVMVDYGHNVAGLSAVGSLARSLCSGKLLGVICAPGDRRDEAIVALGQCAGQVFDTVYIREDRDLRQRQPGEVAELLREGAQAAGLPEHRVKVAPNEAAALEHCLLEADQVDMVVVLYEDLEYTLQIISELHKLHLSSREAVIVAGQ
jgi:cyanophycin synthetase